VRDAWFADAGVLGVARSVEPPGVLPYIARRLDAQSPAGEHEAELEVEALHVDATSFRVIRERCDGDEGRMAALILDVVRERGKLQNPWTGSGGILAGRVTRAGARFWQPELLGELVVPLASLVAIPLRLDEVGPVSSPHVPARGRAIVTGRMSCAVVPDDLPLAATMSALDVYPAASHARSLTRPGDHVLVLGAGNAGLLAAAAADEAGGVVTAVDVAPAALERVATAKRVHADATDSVAVLSALDRRADLTLVCTSVPGCEATAILATEDTGAVLFFSTATSFPAAALGADGISSHARLLIPNGYTEDRGAYALDLLRRLPSLRAAFEA
jgi:L-erythro-3,5-diaminohexanoate dehydrogenase